MSKRMKSILRGRPRFMSLRFKKLGRFDQKFVQSIWREIELKWMVVDGSLFRIHFLFTDQPQTKLVRDGATRRTEEERMKLLTLLLIANQQHST